MFKKKTICMLLALFLVFSSLAACSKSSKESKSDSEETSFSVTDMTGRTLSFDKPAEKIVVLSAGECEIVCALGGKDLIVGRGEYCNYPEDITDIPAISSGSETNVEQIIALAPDTVIMSTMDQTIEQIQAIEDAGIKVVSSKETDIEGVYQNIECIGKVIGKSNEAATLIEDMKSTFDSVRAEESTGKTVYFEVSPLEWGLWTAGSGTFMDEIASTLGLENIFSDIEGWAEISEEQVISRNPDYIVTITMYYGEGTKPDEEIASRAGWSSISAVQNGKIYNANSDELSRPSPRLSTAAQQLSEFINAD